MSKNMPELDLFSLDAYDYVLPEELIAKHPLPDRDRSRLLVLDRQAGTLSEIPFYHILDLLEAGDSIILNDTKVIPARLMGQRSHGGITEVLLTRSLSSATASPLWEMLVRPGKKVKVGSIITFSSELSCEIIETLADGSKIGRFYCKGDFSEILSRHGQLALPHYMKREHPQKIDLERYQTAYSVHPGAIAAPTAGLHFTTDLLNQLTSKNVNQIKITLHVGPGTFRPVQVEDIRHHPMHFERCIINEESAALLNTVPQEGRKRICVGTTSCRALETAASSEGRINPGEYDTNIFIYPGYKFKYTQALLTNFHLPRSTLLMLVCAFAGYELTMKAYAQAIKERFRFYSYGDAMLIL